MTFMVDKAAHDRRVTELLAANNAEVEKRRAATALLREAETAMHAVLGSRSLDDQADAMKACGEAVVSIQAYLGGAA